MKNRTIPHVFIATVVTGMLAACNTSKPPDASPIPLALPADNTSTATPATPSASGASQPMQSTAPPTSIPAATDDIWKALDKQSADLQSAIQNGALKDVHGSADAIRDLTAALPAHASRLSADAKTKLQQDVTLIATYVEKLDTAANAGDQAGAKANYEKLNDVLGGITRFP